VYEFRKWGIIDLRLYELADDQVKREHPVWKEAVKLFRKDIEKRLVKKYPKEDPSVTFISEEGEEDGRKDFVFKGRKLLLDLAADNKPNGAGGPGWSATLRATWDLDKAKFDSVEFRPGRVSIRPNL
jgi:hypothetical protein